MSVRIHEMTTTEIAMRAFDLVRRNSSQPRTLRHFADLIHDQTGASRATAYRLARMATDIACIHVLSQWEAATPSQQACIARRAA